MTPKPKIVSFCPLINLKTVNPPTLNPILYELFEILDNFRILLFNISPLSFIHLEPKRCGTQRRLSSSEHWQAAASRISSAVQRSSTKQLFSWKDLYRHQLLKLSKRSNLGGLAFSLLIVSSGRIRYWNLTFLWSWTPPHKGIRSFATHDLVRGVNHSKIPRTSFLKNQKNQE